jgi:hypothetical protein
MPGKRGCRVRSFPLREGSGWSSHLRRSLSMTRLGKKSFTPQYRLFLPKPAFLTGIVARASRVLKIASLVSQTEHPCAATHGARTMAMDGYVVGGRTPGATGGRRRQSLSASMPAVTFVPPCTAYLQSVEEPVGCTPCASFAL